MEGKTKEKSKGPSASFRMGAIALAFLIVGYESALFVHKAAVARVVANSDHPDTVYIVRKPVAQTAAGIGAQVPVHHAETLHRESTRTAEALGLAGRNSPRKYESFRFDPNTASLGDFMRLGFTEKQAQAILNYRSKGGRFRRKGDFAKSFVVADSVYRRLEPWISIPKVDINKADSASFDTLPGIGGWFAKKMVDYRRLLGGYSCTEQLLEIYNFGQERYDGLKDLVTCTPAKAYPFWALPSDSLAGHPHIRSRETARAIVLYRENNPRGLWTLEGLKKAGVITEDQFGKLSRCNLEKPAPDVSP